MKAKGSPGQDLAARGGILLRGHEHDAGAVAQGGDCWAVSWPFDCSSLKSMNTTSGSSAVDELQRLLPAGGDAAHGMAFELHGRGQVQRHNRFIFHNQNVHLRTPGPRKQARPFSSRTFIQIITKVLRACKRRAGPDVSCGVKSP